MSAAMDHSRPDHTRSRSKSTFSFKSDKTHGSDASHGKQHHEHLHETAEEKKRLHFNPKTKADPNAAMNEVQPIATALEKPTLQSLRSFQHVDANGVPIAEPDLSNPTRSRWERPLDTIRSFEAAIDNEYKRRTQAMRGDQSEIMGGFASRRSSYYGGGYETNRYSQASSVFFGGGRPAPQPRESWAESGYGGPSAGYQRSRYNRMQPEPTYNGRHNNGQNVYPTPGYQQSRDTVNTGGSNGSQSDPYSNDPSENSSIEQRGGPVRDPGEQYGFTGFGNGPEPILEEYSHDFGPSQNEYFGYQQGGAVLPPPVPAKSGPPPPPVHNPNMIKLNSTMSNGQAPSPSSAERPNVLSRKGTSETTGKRGSWFKKRFSKN